MTESAAPPPGGDVLFAEQGASWLWLLTGPGAGIAMALIQLSAGVVQWIVPVAFFVLVTVFLGVQVKAARIHTSVELTADTLRQGTEVTPVADIVRVYPAAEGSETPKWQSARALGELTGVPRGRTGIGVRLAGDRTAQAWARKHQQLRAALTSLVEERIPPERAS
ncbi:DUF3093 domain-containing protein [Mycolicibacterium sp. 018/SC-01/001]|uniref:DUF3093 domain-containing protein n=1 Tax=Mycolicibacterium sp. 018/SC-01/001 TaxID=2592069 RepID=UPI0011807C68|nr:DUF3093 domain-containing protein [Mycolicibacterium sp. 018/SC-01/001]TRW86389.1 DUF3093 domain-containing protein [Mycolicibacterium sp. 018/SC-01/001]